MQTFANTGSAGARAPSIGDLVPKQLIRNFDLLAVHVTLPPLQRNKTFQFFTAFRCPAKQGEWGSG